MLDAESEDELVELLHRFSDQSFQNGLDTAWKSDMEAKKKLLNKGSFYDYY